jgi:pimeloyl-ACP methyl ester carboxylesterase
MTVDYAQRSMLGTGSRRAAGASLLSRYRSEIGTLKRGLRARSKVARTALGPVEYALVGEGPPALAVHGICGGYDQGLLALRMWKGFPGTMITVSRPGYLRTPLRVGASWAAQADSYAALLDKLGVDKVVVVAMSGAGPSVLEFALRHPKRCAALVMLSTVSKRLDPGLTRGQKALLKVLNTDLGLWLFGALAPERLMTLNGVGESTLQYIRHDPEKVEIIGKLVKPLPMSMRRAGFNNDLKQFLRTPEYPVDQIEARTLVVHGTADGVVPIEHAEFLAGGVQDAERYYVSGGGHLCPITHSKEVIPRIMEFVQPYA